MIVAIGLMMVLHVKVVMVIEGGLGRFKELSRIMPKF